eukprot:scaffold4955_cov71-Skeletonema_marinoi.AAC.2
MGTIAVLDVEDDLGCDDAVAGATFLFPNANPLVLFLLLLVVAPPILLSSPASNLANRLLPPPDAVEANGDFDAVDDDDVVLPPPKLNPPPPPPDAAAALLVASDDAAVDNPEVNDKAFDADLDDDDDDVPPKEDDAKPENGSDVVLCFVSLLVAADDDDDDLPAEGSAVMKDEPNMLSLCLFVLFISTAFTLLGDQRNQLINGGPKSKNETRRQQKAKTLLLFPGCFT